ncbi:type III pantothenate kinase [Lutimonas zeaxanthinifaciens]|uniref:type III pantothenate kinase n=1 Tax=Lutimonas zeaxanthinifaciens TaxID=3060215 RepID=UPI00265CEF7D|nr:type III pantothenate kinase [Lutimonas sp. YSD2104]WKK66194.1 type III pantothenate kinase [Lutimonas sp. YSD2104]
MNLVIDIGNTQIKVAVFEDTILLYKDQFPAEQIVSKIISLTEQYDIQRSIVSHVSSIAPMLWKELEGLLKPLKLNHDTLVPFENKYLTPKTLGVDRIALMAGAVNQFPKTNVLVIDAGSCITFDFLNEYGSYFGGDISPGILMRYKAVNHFTANLPLLEKTEHIPDNGNSTENAIHRGVLNGVIQEIEGVISQYRTNYQKLTVVLTGGDTIFLAKNIKSSIFAIPNFLLEGLNSILIHNIDE